MGSSLVLKCILDALTGNLISFERGDRLIEEAAKQFREKFSIYGKEYLEEQSLVMLDILSNRLQAFINQRKISVDKAREIIWQLRESRHRAIKAVSDKAIFGAYFPLLPVISKKVLGISLQMEMIAVKNAQSGEIIFGKDLLETLRPKNEIGVYNVEQSDLGCYWMTEIDKGAYFIGENPKEANKIILESCRWPLSAEEVVPLWIYNCFKSPLNDMWAFASRFGGNIHSAEDSIVPLISLENGNTPVLTSCLPVRLNDCGTPSCANRFTFNSQLADDKFLR